MPDAEIHFCPAFYAASTADHLLTALNETLNWRQDEIRMFGRWCKIPRLQAWYGSADAHYRYSGLALQPEPFTPELAMLREHLSQHCQQDFNAVLANLYRHGKDSMGWHSDDEKELGPNPVIASLSFGEPRRFQFRHRQNPAQKHEITLTHGSLLIMTGSTQHHWHHGIPKQAKAQNPRINLTFRRIQPTGG